MEEIISKETEVVQSVEGAETAAPVAVEAVMAAEEGAVAVKKKKPINRQKLQDNLWGWLFCAPLLFGTIVFVYIALILSVALSFSNYSMVQGNLMAYLFGGGFKTVGGDAFYWYKYMFTLNETVVAWKDVYSGLFNAVFYMIGIPIGMVLSMFFAVCMSRDIKGANVYRIIYYIPSVASTVAITYTFKRLFGDGQGGVLNNLLGTQTRWLSGQYPTTQPWDSEAIRNKWVVIIMMSWKGLGGTIILYIAGLSGINASHKEAAAIDGASSWTTFWVIVIPQLWPTIFYNIVTSVIGGMQIYTEPDLLFRANGAGTFNRYISGYVGLIVANGPMGGSQQPRVGYASALGVFLALIIMILTLFQFYLDSKTDL